MVIDSPGLSYDGQSLSPCPTGASACDRSVFSGRDTRLRLCISYALLTYTFLLMLVYASTTTTGPFRQGRSGEDWLFNAPLTSLAGPVDTDPFTALTYLTLMPATTTLDPSFVALLSSPMHDYLQVHLFDYGFISAHPFACSIASFMARRREYGLQVDEERFLTSFALPPDHPAAVHPVSRSRLKPPEPIV
jgi:hypothetical protein